MSRSYKHTPICKDKSTCKFQKRYANRRIRKVKALDQVGGTEVALKGGMYKKMHESWDICDFQFSLDEQEYKECKDKKDKDRLRKLRSVYINK